MRLLRLLAILLAAFLFAPQIFAQQNSAASLQSNFAGKLSADLNRIASSYDGVVGIFVKDLTSGESFAINADASFATASSIKIPILVELMRQAQSGRINLAERVDIHRAGLVGGSGVLQFFSDGGSAISIHDLAVLMIVLSDNSATNILIDRVGIGNVNSLLRDHGFDKIVLARKMIDLASEQANRENRATPRQMATLVEELNAGKLLDAAHTKQALEILEYPKDSPLRAGVPPEITVAEKPGSLTGAQCDTGIVLLAGRPYIISVMTAFNSSDGNPAITAVSARVFSYFNRLAHANAYGVRVH